LIPADQNAGIVFRIRRGDLTLADIPATYRNIAQSDHRTVLTYGSHSIQTVEHLMAALNAMNIDNLIIEVWGNELPIFDGSADGWVFLLKSAGIIEQNAGRKYIKILREVRVDYSDGWATLTPSSGKVFSYYLNYEHPMIGMQHGGYDLDSTIFEDQLSKARTFGFYTDLPILHANGLSYGANILNSLAFSTQNLLNSGGMRWNDEPLRHKILDAVGDVYLAGYPIIGKFHGHMSGHQKNIDLLIKVFSNQSNWKYE
jgi:UDP-3-O-[3-hydroxymyristoyl] N-acetylglucosamine deacetylase